MPFYISRASIISRYGEETLTFAADRDGDQDLDEDAVDEAIADAEAKVDSYIGARYPLPLPGVTDREDPEANTSVPRPLRRAAVDIAVYFLVPDHDQLTEEKTKRYDAACKWLQDVANGDATLGLPETDQIEGEISHTTSPRVFTRGTMKGLL